MDIHKEWDQLNSQLFSNQSLKKEEIMNAISSESSSVIAQLKKGLVMKSYWCLFFIFMFAILMFISRDNMEQVIAIGIVAFLYVVGFVMIHFAAKDLNENVDSNGNVLSALKNNAKVIKRAIGLEKNIFLYTSPIIIICSMFYGRLHKGSSYAELIQDASFLKAIIIASVILVPAAFIMGKYLNNKAFTPLIENLEKNIHQLEGLERS